jgi:hypothetical protein
MTKYELLSELAVRDSEALHAAREACRLFAFKLAAGIAAYLEVPEGKMIYRDVGEDLSIKEEMNEVRYGIPDMTYGKDDFWYFAVQITFGDPCKTFGAYGLLLMLFGVKKAAQGFIIRSGKDTTIPNDNPDALKPFYERQFDELKDYYASPATGPRKRIGFTPPE